MAEHFCRSPSGGGASPHQRHSRVSPVSTPVSRSPFSAPLSQKSRALHLARAQQFAPARQAFQSLLEESPGDVKAWISWAQVFALYQFKASSIKCTNWKRHLLNTGNMLGHGWECLVM